MPETLHAREIVVPHVQLHQVSGQKQLFVRQETFSKQLIYFKYKKIGKKTAYSKTFFPIERYHTTLTPNWKVLLICFHCY
jgi:hypothetical protein